MIGFWDKPNGSNSSLHIDETDFHQMVTVAPNVTIGTCKKRDKGKLKEHQCGVGLELFDAKVRILFLGNRAEFRGLELCTLSM